MTNPPGCGVSHSMPGRAKPWVQDGTAPRRQRRVVGRRTGSRSALIVPRKQGHWPQRDPVEGSEASDYGPVEGPHGKGIPPSSRVNVTSMDNSPGRESMVRGTVCTNACTYGSVGALSG